MSSIATARSLGATAVEGLNHLGLTDLEHRLAATIDILDEYDRPQRALTAIVSLERQVQQAAQGLGRAPRWCGVCAAVALYRTAVSDLVRDLEPSA